MTGPSPPVPTFIALADIVAQTLLCLAPSVLLISVGRTPRTALYLRCEALVLLTLVYAFRYSHLLINFPNLDNIQQYTHLWALILATLFVHLFQTKARFPRTTATDRNNDEVQEVEKLLEPLPAAIESKYDPQRTTTSVRRFFAFDRRLFGNILFWSFLPTLYSGNHSLLSYAFDAYYHKPHPSFLQAIYAQLSIATTLLEMNAMILVFGRFIMQRRAQINLPPPTETQLKDAQIDLEEWKKRLQMPTGVWAFLWLSMASAALALPGYIHKTVGVKPGADLELLMWPTVGNSMLLVMFVGTMLLYRFMPPSRIQLPKGDAEHIETSSLA